PCSGTIRRPRCSSCACCPCRRRSTVRRRCRPCPRRRPLPHAGRPIHKRNSRRPRPAPQSPAPRPPAEPTDNPAALAPSAADLLARAKAAGGIDSALRKENPRRGIQAPIVTAQMKLERGIARAGELAPNKWYQAPKTEEILDPGGYGRRRYRVTTAMGTYCVTYESNHGPDGRDTMRDGIPPKLTNCDEDEQPATFQKWE
ncbi:MAG: hypothetical protein JWQ80_2565, partial [Massilia sp.]|nr:hypothetical protein [Massilia sp.]